MSWERRHRSRRLEQQLRTHIEPTGRRQTAHWEWSESFAASKPSLSDPPPPGRPYFPIPHKGFYQLGGGSSTKTFFYESLGSILIKTTWGVDWISAVSSERQATWQRVTMKDFLSLHPAWRESLKIKKNSIWEGPKFSSEWSHFRKICDTLVSGEHAVENKWVWGIPSEDRQPTDSCSDCWVKAKNAYFRKKEKYIAGTWGRHEARVANVSTDRKSSTILGQF